MRARCTARVPRCEEPLSTIQDAPCLPIRRAGHNLINEAVKGLDAGRRLAASEDRGLMHIERGQVGPGTPAFVFVFNAHGTTGSGRHARMSAVACLDTRLFVRRNDEFVVAEGTLLPAALIQVEDRYGFLRELGVAGKDPRPVLPWANRVTGEPPPNGAATDRADQLRSSFL